MAFGQKVTLPAFRKDPLQFVMAVEGYDLTGATMTMTVRLRPDAPGDPILLLGTVTVAGDQGIRVAEVTTDADGVTSSTLEILVPKAAFIAAMAPYQAIPPLSTEFGGQVVLAFDFQWLLAAAPDPSITNVEETVLWGDLIIMGSVND